ncbi:MAG: hypothetical protein Q9164_000709 [Protoblastenia rupestris]
MSSCLGFGRKSRDEDTEALLPRYADDTSLQRSLHQKMHTYQMLKALSTGFMPSTEQVIVNLRTLLASDFLNPDNPDLSDSGRLLLKYCKQWLTQFIEVLRSKNDDDQIQDFMWLLSKSRLSVDTDDLAKSASKIKTKADATAAYESFRTVGSLLLTNSDFRLFLGDLGTIGRQVFADTAFSLSNVADDVGKKLEPTEQDSETIKHPGSEQGRPPTAKDLGEEAADVSKVVVNGVAKTGQDAFSSLQENITGEQKETLIYRLKEAVTKLRKRNDYSDSVSTISLLIKRYAIAYSRAADRTLSAAQEDVNTNPELDKAIENFWSFVSSFGDKKEWEALEQKVNTVMEHSQKDPEFENLMVNVGNSVQKLLSDPDFFDSADKKIQELRDEAKKVDNESTLRRDIDSVLSQLQKTFNAVLQDTDISNLLGTTTKIINVLSPTHELANKDLLQDSLQVFIPLLIQAVQYVPIPRIEISVPEVDLLLENLILEPGRTVNNTSFLPYKLLVQTYNDLEIRKTHTRRTTTSTTNLVTVAINGLSMRADEVGFWLRAHSGFLQLADEGIASFQLDERGIDIAIDIEIGKEKLEKILTLKKVRVHVHKLTYQLRKSKFSWLAWLIKPLLRPIVRKVLEKQLASAIADGLHAANRELLFARERLRATRISDPQDVRTFIKAVITRLTPAEDPDVYTAVGVKPSEGVFKGVYAPGSVVKLWEEEARLAGERVEDNEVKAGGWRNEIFDVQTTMMGQ